MILNHAARRLGVAFAGMKSHVWRKGDDMNLVVASKC
jgi:hypothetical protein